MLKVIFLLTVILTTSTANANSIFHESIQRVGSIGDGFATSRIEAIVIGYAAASYKYGCKTKVDFDPRRMAEKAWSEIKYNANQDKRLVDVTIKYMMKNYECR